MNTDNLSDKQKANRAYYAANADRIREKKRQQYFLKIAKQKKESAKSIKRNTQCLSPERSVKATGPIIKKTKKQNIRSKIEDYLAFKKIEQWF